MSLPIQTFCDSLIQAKTLCYRVLWEVLLNLHPCRQQINLTWMAAGSGLLPLILEFHWSVQGKSFSISTPSIYHCPLHSQESCTESRGDNPQLCAGHPRHPFFFLPAKVLLCSSGGERWELQDWGCTFRCDALIRAGRSGGANTTLLSAAGTEKVLHAAFTTSSRKRHGLGISNIVGSQRHQTWAFSKLFFSNFKVFLE